MNEIQTVPLSILVIDDEPLARRRLLRLLGAMPAVEVVGTAGNVQQACSMVAELSPDAILLDIQMPGGTGFDVLERLGDHAPAVVFVTAFDHYALRSTMSPSRSNPAACAPRSSEPASQSPHARAPSGCSNSTKP